LDAQLRLAAGTLLLTTLWSSLGYCAVLSRWCS